MTALFRRLAPSRAPVSLPSIALSVTVALAACGGAEGPVASPPAGTAAPLAASGSAAPAATTGPTTSAAASGAPAPLLQTPPTPDTAEGGRLFDKFYGKEKPFAAFKPDSGKKGSPDGKGGVDDTGILKFENGDWLQNDARHDYRLKNLFGWDLKGKAGIYGPTRMKKPYVRATNLLAGKQNIDELASLLTTGNDDIPAYGPVLDGLAIRNIAAFIVGVRDGALPHPDQIFSLAPPDRGHYALASGGDAARGKQIFAERCTGCHGADGTQLTFDDGAFSLGSHARQKAYEDWAKILNGQPGTPMGRQVKGATGKEMAQEILDLFAALCDRKAFPRGKATADDVKDGDGRCGAYLK